jgi:hypothetical protein
MNKSQLIESYYKMGLFDDAYLDKCVSVGELTQEEADRIKASKT